MAVRLRPGPWTAEEDVDRAGHEQRARDEHDGPHPEKRAPGGARTARGQATFTASKVSHATASAVTGVPSRPRENSPAGPQHPVTRARSAAAQTSQNAM